MIAFLSLWVKRLGLALIIVSILEMLLPKNNNTKYVKLVMGLYILFIIIEPYIDKSKAFDFNEINFNTYFEDNYSKNNRNEIINQESMDIRINQLYEEMLEKDIGEKLNNIGYEINSCKVATIASNDNYEIKKINISVKCKIENNNNNNSDEINDESENIEEKDKYVLNKVQEIKKIEVDRNKENEFNNNENNSSNNKEENKKITLKDIKIIKDFLKNEYGVDEKCLKIN